MILVDAGTATSGSRQHHVRYALRSICQLFDAKEYPRAARAAMTSQEGVKNSVMCAIARKTGEDASTLRE